jgi:hypothetical protein
MLMARPLRIEYPGAIYHATFRGNEWKPVFRSDADRRQVLQQMAEAHDRYQTRRYVSDEPPWSWIDYAPLLALLTPQKASSAVTYAKYEVLQVVAQELRVAVVRWGERRRNSPLRAVAMWALPRHGGLSHPRRQPPWAWSAAPQSVND